VIAGTKTIFARVELWNNSAKIIFACQLSRIGEGIGVLQPNNWQMV
jgi:hypothetical protein